MTTFAWLKHKSEILKCLKFRLKLYLARCLEYCNMIVVMRIQAKIDIDIHPRVMKLFCKPTLKQKLLKNFVAEAINLYKI